MKKILLILAMGLLSIGGLHSGEVAGDSIKVFFRHGYRYVEPGFRNNRAALDHFVQVLKDVKEQERLSRIVIQSYASPDGTNKANARLSSLRADSLASYIIRHAGISPNLVEKQSCGVAWDMLRAMVDTSDMPGREAVLDVLDNTPLWVYDERGRVVTGRKKELMDLQGGRPYRYMYSHIFPDLRSCVGATFYYVEPEPVPEPVDSVRTDTVAPVVVTEPVPELVDTVRTDTVQTVVPAVTGGEEGSFRPIIAVKTNLLYWATIMPDFKSYTFVPNLELEWFFADRWSLTGIGNYSKWAYRDDNWFGISDWSLEPRWWLKDDGSYRWLYVGVYGQVGDYDVQNDRIETYDGNTGRLWGLGLSVGAAIPITKHFGVEVGIRGGYRHSKVKAYTYEAPDYFLDHTGTDYHWGVTGIKVSVYYRFGKSSK